MKIQRSGVVLACLALLASFPLLASDHPTLARGSAPSSLGSGGGIDTVNLFNGSLSMSVPLGVRYPVSEHLSYGFTLYYSSRVWDYELIDNLPDPWTTEADLSEDFNAGPGWRISFGELKLSSRPIDTVYIDVWTYVAPDGSEHTFYETLHEGDGNQHDDFTYTRDNTYLRMMNDPGAEERIIEFPNGTRHYFENFVTAGTPDWRLAKMEDRWGNWVEVFYQTTEDLYGNYTETWYITDSVIERNHHTLVFSFDDNDGGPGGGRNVIPGLGRKHLVAAHLAAPDGHTADYLFDYEPSDIPVACKDTSDVTPDLLENVYMLSRIVMPNGEGSYWPNGLPSYCQPGPCEEYQISYFTAGDFLPAWQCWGDSGQEYYGRPNEQPGAIKSLRLPTGGTTEWTYENWQFPGEYDLYQNILANVTGVDTKTIHSDNNASAEWDYTPDPVVVATDVSIVNKLTDPEGNDSQYYFRTKVSQSESDWSGWDFGLPFDSDQTDPLGFETNMSSQHYQGSVAPANLLRTNWVLYEHDVLPDIPAADERLAQDWYNTNRRVLQTLTTYGSNSEKYSRVRLTKFDGLGHYRKRRHEGNFPDDDAISVNFSNYNPGNFEYAINNSNDQTGDFIPWTTNAPWILNTLAYNRFNHYTGAHDYARKDFCFDSSNGALLRVRSFRAKGVTRGPDDIIVEYERDASGAVTEERYYGADSAGQGLSLSSDLCNLALPATPVYQIGHISQYGVRSTSYYEDPVTGYNTDIFLQNSFIDPNTGLVTTEIETSGYWTEITFDALARPTGIETAEAAQNEIAYIPATGDPSLGTLTHAEVHVTTKNKAGTADLGESETEYDGLGRTVEERHLVADNDGNGTADEVMRQTQYADSGRLDRVSTWTSGATPTGWTTYDDYDRWGRPGTITPPDGFDHRTTLTYDGVWSVARKVNIGTSRDPLTGQVQESQSTTTEHYDSLGALRKVTEPSGPGGDPEDWLYEYDVGGNLIRVTGGVQTRTFTYDALGFLRSEDIPEREGPITYDGYDPFGNVLAMTEDDSRSRSKTFTYDAMNRLLSVYSGQTLTKEYEYWSIPSVGWSEGRLKKATRHYQGLFDDDEISRAFEYQGVGPNVSKVTTEIVIPSQPPAMSFVQDYTWDELGRLETLRYPRLDGVNQRTVTYTYDQGWLEEISDGGGTTYVSDIDYHANGMVSFVTHGNGATDQTLIGTNGIARPTEINAAVIGDSWTTGQIGYDGAGNITTMGGDTFTYDGVSRLATSKRNYASKTRVNKFLYDLYGNLIREKETVTMIGRSRETTVTTFPVDATTNRLTIEKYDYHGQQVTLLLGESETLWPKWDHHFEEITRIDNSLTGDYLYDADSERVAVDSHYFIRDLDGKVLSEFDGITWKRDYFYRGSQMVAAQDSSDGLLHFHLDHLGSPRMVSDAAGQKVADHAYGPFGFEISLPDLDTITKKYTGHERDYTRAPASKYDLDYMHARYYSPWQHRFLSVDPIGGDPRQPQSWNAFSYVLNNPINLVDPYGLIECGFTGPGEYSCTEEFLPIDLLSDWDDWKNRGNSAWAGQELDPNALEVMRIVGQAAPLARAYEFLADIYSGFFHGGGAVDDILRAGLAKFGARSSGRAVARGIVRATPRGLTEQLALAEAKGGAGTRIMKGMIKDPKFPEAVWAKMQHVHKGPGGERIVIHYWENLQTGARQGFKFK